MRRTILFVGLTLALGFVRDAGWIEGRRLSGAVWAATVRPDLPKRNAYAAIAQSTDAVFAEGLWHYETWRSAGGGAVQDVAPVVDPRQVSASLHALSAAEAGSPSMPDIDRPAAAFIAALKAFEPIDKEAFARRLARGCRSCDRGDPAYIAALMAVVQAEADFRAIVAMQDEVDAQLAFEASARSSRAYYRAGVDLYRKRSVRLGKAVFSTRGSNEAITLFRAGLDDLAAMAAGFEEAVRNASSERCPAAMKTIEAFVASGRTAARHAENGAYRPGPASNGSSRNPILATDAVDFDLKARAMTKAFDRPPC